MQTTRQQPLPVGTFDFTLYGHGRLGRQTSSRFSMRCDAIGLHKDEILLLSVVGPETSVKALAAGLRSSGKQQQRIDYGVRVGDLHRALLTRCPDGYQVHRVKLDYGLWHVLFLSKRDGFLPVLTEDAFWQHLQQSQFTTPLLREWAPWLYQKMKKQDLVVELTQSGCRAGLIEVDNDALDKLVSEGIRGGHLAINRLTTTSHKAQPAIDPEINDLDEYMRAHGALLGKQAEQALQPLHVPGRDPLRELEIARTPFEAQSHVIEAIRKAMRRQKALLLVSEMGTGKTLMAIAAIDAHAHGPYRALVFCPGQLVHKWEREIRETLPNTDVIQLDSWRSLLRLDRTKRPSRTQWYVIARDRAKLGSKWQPAVQRYKHVLDCFTSIVTSAGLGGSLSKGEKRAES